ncbi:hypothetical protein GF340_05970 [Candidatus Peregrinibacteria bacterium]|nr:hypothetical protein [Candidatus Peregrinibacteria bacterium]
MINKDIKIPKLFQELHGYKSKISTIVLVYLTGIISGSIIIIDLLKFNLEIWKYTLLGIIVVDIAGGVVANLSSSTNSYYRDKKKLRIKFLLVHFIQPLVLYFIFPNSMYFFIFLFSYTIISALIINMLKEAEDQQNIASTFLTIGAILCILIKTDYLTINIIGVLYMIKIILGFSVRRPRFD